MSPATVDTPPQLNNAATTPLYCAPNSTTTGTSSSSSSSSSPNKDKSSSTMMKVASLQVPHHLYNDQQDEEKNAEAVEWTLTASETLHHPSKDRKTTIIGSWELAHCPCCRRRPSQGSNEMSSHDTAAATACRLATTTSLMDQCELDDDDDDESDEEEELLGLEHAANVDESFGLIPGVLENGVSYTPTQILVQGWLHKKGTGQDWLKSRAWKARWGRLVWAKVEGYGAIEVPLLLMYWYPSSKTASTAIVLSRSTVVVAVDYAPDPTAWNAHRFEIRHVQGCNDDADEITQGRIFSAANRSERDAWVYAMAQALLDYAKSKQVHDRATKGQLRAISPPPRRETTTAAPLRHPSSPPPPRPRSPVPTNLPKSPRSMQQQRKNIMMDY